MAFESGTAYPESDADDEYERSVHDSSPVLATDDEDMSGSEGTRGQTSNEHTPTTYGRMGHDRMDEMSDEPITKWNADDCADFIGSLELGQYAQDIIDHRINGEALVSLQLVDLKDIGITSLGHRLTILKNVYDLKIKHDIPIEADDYVPPSAEDSQPGFVGYRELKHILQEIDRKNDERFSFMEEKVGRLESENRRLREELLPVFKMAKEAQPLPFHPPSSQQSAHQGYTQQYANAYGDAGQSTTPAAPTPALSGGGGLQRKFSTKQFYLGSTPKNASPTHMQTSQERGMMEASLDPSAAAERAVLSSSHLAAMNGGNPQQSPGLSPHQNMPSPTSPPHQPKPLSGSTLASRSYGPGTSSRNTYADELSPNPPSTGYGNSTYGRESIVRPPPSSRRAPTPALNDSASASNASVEIFKSFKVGMDDPCYKVLPAALKKYNITASPDQYALYIVYGDQERCLERDEKPLILFKELDKGGKKPMFMLRKTNMHPDSQRGANYDPPGGII